MRKFIRNILLTVLLAGAAFPLVAQAARTSVDWVNPSGTSYIQPNFGINGMDLLIFGSNHYINFNAITGSSGYGFRDNNGAMEFKNSGGSWTGIGSGSSGGVGYPFPVTGNATTTLTQFNGGLTSYASTTIGDGSITGGLTINGAATTTGLATFSGGLALPYAKTIDVTRTIPTTVGNEVDIGNFVLTNGAANLEIWLTVPSGSYSQNKRYFMPVSFNATNNTWEKAIPIATTGAYSGNDADLEINVNNFTASLRIRRTGGSTAGTADITMIQQGVVTDVFTPSTATASASAPTVSYIGTSLSQINGKVGVNIDNPGANFQFAAEPAGGYSFTSWAGLGYTIPVFMDATQNNGGSSLGASVPVLVLGRDGVSGQSYPNFAELKVARYANTGTNAKTQLDFALTNGDADTSGTNVLSLQSGGNVGLSTTSPGSILSVNNVANFTAATSTFYSTGGINLAAGCFSINNICVGGSSGSSGGFPFTTLTNWATTTSATTTAIQAPAFFASSTLASQFPEASTTNIGVVSNVYFGATGANQINNVGTILQMQAPEVEFSANVSGTAGAITFDGLHLSDPSMFHFGTLGTGGASGAQWGWLFALNTQTTNASSTNATTTSQYITGVKSALDLNDSNGQVTAYTGTNPCSANQAIISLSALGVGSCSSTFLTSAVTSVTGTTNQVASTGGTTPVLSLPSLVIFPGNIEAFASSTIGDSTQAGGLTVNGGATTTLGAYFATTLAVGTQPSSFSIQTNKTTVGINNILFQNNDGATADGERIFLGTRATIGDTTVGGGIEALRTNINTSGDTDLLFQNSAGTVLNTNLIIKANGNIGVSSSTPGSILSIGVSGNASGINLSLATSTFSNAGGINLTTGCFSINNVCVGGSSGSVTSVSGTANQILSSGGSAPVLSLPNLVLFPVAASSTLFSNFGTAYFGGSATSSFNSAGALTLATPLATGSGGTGSANLGTGVVQAASGALSAANPTRSFIIGVASTTVLVGSTTSPVFSFPFGLTVTSWSCNIQPGGAAAEVEWQYANPTAYTTVTPTYLAASTTPGIVAISSNNTPTAAATSTLIVGNPTGSALSGYCTFVGNSATI